MAENPEYLRLPNRVVEETYRKEFTESELAAIRAEFTNESFELSLIKAEKKKVTDEFNEELKAKKAIVARLLPIAKNGYEMVTSKVHTHYDDSTGMVDFIDVESGDIVGSRRQRPEERTALFTITD